MVDHLTNCRQHSEKLYIQMEYPEIVYNGFHQCLADNRTQDHGNTGTVSQKTSVMN